LPLIIPESHRHLAIAAPFDMMASVLTSLYASAGMPRHGKRTEDTTGSRQPGIFVGDL
jgi:hypothetical protein